jgi:hypothetical protein
MTCQHVLNAFKKAGFPLVQIGLRRYQYTSSIVLIRFDLGWSNTESSELTVCFRRGGITEFTSPSKALTYIQRVLSIECISKNKFNLKTEPRANLQLLTGGAA